LSADLDERPTRRTPKSAELIGKRISKREARR